MGMARFIVCDVLDGLRSLPDASVDLVLTSPPFLALRSYLPADHPDKARERGSEATPGEFIDALLDVVVECRRVLAPHGSLVIELGDTYAGAATAGQRYDQWSGKAEGYPRHASDKTGDGWPAEKSLCLIPESFRWALAYGRNPFTGRETEPWRVRNVIRWCRPNPPVGALGDKFRPATSEMVVACVGTKRYFDLDAVRTEHSVDPTTMGGNGYGYRQPVEKGNGTVSMPGNPFGAPPLDWWKVAGRSYPGQHHATWPPELIIRPIKAMCPERVCRTCGAPSERIVDSQPAGVSSRGATERTRQGRGRGDGSAGWVGTTATTLGWTDCGHDDWRRGIVLDPFVGSGTTLEVATGHGRDAIGFDLDERNAELARQRVGMLLMVEHLSGNGAKVEP